MPAPTSPTVAAAPPQAVTPPPASRRLLLALTCSALGLAVVATVAAAWILFVPRSPVAEAVNPAPAHVMRVGTLVVNVAGTNGRRYLRTTLELGTASARDGRRLEDHRTPLMDAALGVLSATPLEDLLDHDRRAALKHQMRARLNATVGGEPIEHVYFTEFVIQ